MSYESTNDSPRLIMNCALELPKVRARSTGTKALRHPKTPQTSILDSISELQLAAVMSHEA